MPVEAWNLTNYRLLHYYNHWQILTDSSGTRYREITLPLYTQNQVSGYLQVARSITDLDQHLAYLRLALVLGIANFHDFRWFV